MDFRSGLTGHIKFAPALDGGVRPCFEFRKAHVLHVGHVKGLVLRVLEKRGRRDGNSDASAIAIQNRLLDAQNARLAFS